MLSSKNLPKFTVAHQKTLREQTIDADQPGTLVRDFETLLRFISEHEIPLSGILQLLPMNALPELNAQMAHPFDVKLKRPQLKSFPLLNGIFMVLRASGLARIDNTGKKPLLRLDEAAHANWQKLNATEKYFALLQTWLLLADESVIGDRDMFGPLHKCAMFWTRREATAPTNPSGHESLRYWPGLHNLALLEAFGLVKIQHGVAKEGEGWQIKRISFTPFGNALFALLGENEPAFVAEPLDFLLWANDEGDDDDESEDDQNEDDGEENSAEVQFNPFAHWQPFIAPYFPEWRESFVLPHRQAQQGIYLFKVLVDKDIWRRIQIPSHLVLDDLSEAILRAFKFDDDHLYAFIFRDRFGKQASINHPFMEEAPDASEVTVSELPLQVGDGMIFLYDFGDRWEFAVILEKIDAPNAKIKKASVIESQGKAPQQYYYDDDEDDDDEEDDE